MRLYPSTDHKFDSLHPYLASHRIKLHTTLLSLRQGVHRSQIIDYLRGDTEGKTSRSKIVDVCLTAIRNQRSVKMLDIKVSNRLFDPMVVFESCVIILLCSYVEEKLKSIKSEVNEDQEKKEESRIRTLNNDEEVMMRWKEGIANGKELLAGIGVGSLGGEVASKGLQILSQLGAKVEKASESQIP